MKKYIFPAFIIVCVIQLLVPAKMIWDREDIMRSGKEFKFIAAPLDPNDPFRGKYLDVDFEPREFIVEKAADWYWGQTIYIKPGETPGGFYFIEEVFAEEPDISDYFKAEVGYVTDNPDKQAIFINYPFNRFYMEESKALPAENIFRDARRDTTKSAYALISVKNGEAVFKDLVIDGTSIKDLAKGN